MTYERLIDPVPALAVNSQDLAGDTLKHLAEHFDNACAKGGFLAATPLAMTTLWMAILAGATVLVIANALRLLRWLYSPNRQRRIPPLLARLVASLQGISVHRASDGTAYLVDLEIPSAYVR
ncbi:MAG: hypothetical protein AB7E81_17830 [Hyphomicrobiaceae bacterium]|jgi:hypothetical protein